MVFAAALDDHHVTRKLDPQLRQNLLAGRLVLPLR